jgi:hypothetical protein
MAKRLFFSQSMLDSMVEAGRITVDRNILTMLAGDNPTFTLLPAYRFVRTIDNAPDPAGLVSRIRSESELKAMGAEVYMDSVIYREVAYQADPGFIAEQQVPGAQPDAAPAPEAKPAGPAAEPPAEAAKDGDDLSKFILDNLL